VEKILRGIKTYEIRDRAVNIRGRVYLYASMTPGPLDEFEDLDAKPGDFPTGILAGTVEIVGCEKKGEKVYHWLLERPQRLSGSLKPENKPQPIWFIPFRR
jgi:hypothetical protein